MKLPEIVKETDRFIVLDKPAGLLSIPDRTNSGPNCKSLLAAKYGSIFTVHRLDKETSGLILFAKTAEAHVYFSKIFEERNVIKEYEGIVIGTLPVDSGIIDQPMAEHPAKNGTMQINPKGKPSQTGFRVIESFGRYSLVAFQLFTGRTHQIRVHMKDFGHPLVCDPVYGDGQPLLVSGLKKKYKHSGEEDERPILNRLALHAAKLQFDEDNGETFLFQVELPKDMRASLSQMRKHLA